jgi:flagellar biosynthesis protein FliR
MSRIVTASKKVGETISISFNFISNLAVSENLNTATVTCTVYSGVDASPSSVISGAASVSGTSIIQLITGGVAGVIYKLLCTATTFAGQILQLVTYLAIIPDLV